MAKARIMTAGILVRALGGESEVWRGRLQGGAWPTREPARDNDGIWLGDIGKVSKAHVARRDDVGPGRYSSPHRRTDAQRHTDQCISPPPCPRSQVQYLMRNAPWLLDQMPRPSYQILDQTICI